MGGSYTEQISTQFTGMFDDEPVPQQQRAICGGIRIRFYCIAFRQCRFFEYQLQLGRPAPQYAVLRGYFDGLDDALTGNLVVAFLPCLFSR